MNEQELALFYDAIKRTDTDFILKACAKDVEWDLFIPSEIPHAGRYMGTGELKEYLERFRETAEIIQLELRQTVADNQTTVAVGWYKIRLKHTSKFFDVSWVHVFDVRDGKIWRFREFFKSAPMTESIAGEPGKVYV
jgi:uncharacterized protein